MTVCERLLRNFKFELPGTSLTELTVDGELVDQPAKVLDGLLGEAETFADSRVVAELAAFKRKFEQEFGVRLTFEGDTVTGLAGLAEERGQSVLQLCEELFRDYQFGLKLIKKNTGQDSFPIPASALKDPDEFLSGLVVASYGREKKTAQEELDLGDPESKESP